jgi:hypothetical protein
VLTLRLIRGSHPLALLRLLLVAAAAGGVGFLLLSALGYALEHPGDSRDSLTRLLWCLFPLATTVQLAAAVARTDPVSRPWSGPDAAGLGPAGPPVLAAVSTAVSCLLGSALALLVFLHLRGGISGLPFAGSAAEPLAADRSLPVPASLTLLVVLPLAASAASAFALRQRRPLAEPAIAAGSGPVPPGWPWGAALIALGVTLETYAARAQGESVPVPGSGVVVGWLLGALGLTLAGPGLTHLVGQVLTSGQPGIMRLLAGRGLQQEAHRIGRPVGVLCAVVSGAIVTVDHYGDARPFGPLTVLGATVVMACAAVSALTAAAESRTARAPMRAALDRLGAPGSLLRGAAALRLTAMMTALAPLTWVIAQLAILPLPS